MLEERKRNSSRGLRGGKEKEGTRQVRERGRVRGKERVECIGGLSGGRGVSRRVGGGWVGAGTVFKRKEKERGEQRVVGALLIPVCADWAKRGASGSAREREGPILLSRVQARKNY